MQRLERRVRRRHLPGQERLSQEQVMPAAWPLFGAVDGMMVRALELAHLCDQRVHVDILVDDQGIELVRLNTGHEIAALELAIIAAGQHRATK